MNHRARFSLRSSSVVVAAALGALTLLPNADALAAKGAHHAHAPRALVDDADADGVLDEHDACPKEAGLPSDDPKLNGCREKFASGAAGPASVTFTGFRALDNGGSQIFVELTGPIAVEVGRVRGQLVYTLVATKIPSRNNRNPLLASEFASPVISARLFANKKTKAAELVVALRSDVRSTQRLVKRNGGAVLEIEFPPLASSTATTGTAPKKP